MLRSLLPLALVCVFAAGCSTKVDLNTEWQDITIVYGLMDQHEEYHYIKINKAFLGNGNYYDYAQIRDSSEYANVTAYIQEMSNGVIVNTYPLRDTELVNKSTDGVFYAPEHTVYYFRKTGLNALNTYRFVAQINEGTARAKEVTGETALVNDFSISNFTSLALGTYNIGGPIVNNYGTHTVKFAPPSNSDMYEIVWRIKWDEYTSTDTTRMKYEWIVGKTDREALVDGLINFDVSGEAFFKTLASTINANNDPNVYKRVWRGVDVIVYAASADLETYITINTPQNGLVQERPEFTNVSNGLGLFSSRNHVTVANKSLGLGPMRLLVHGEYTGGLLFCTDTTSTIYTLASSPTVVCP